MCMENVHVRRLCTLLHTGMYHVPIWACMRNNLCAASSPVEHKHLNLAMHSMYEVVL